jgi:tetratricopeptide (TPR) repeat protein
MSRNWFWKSSSNTNGTYRAIMLSYEIEPGALRGWRRGILGVLLSITAFGCQTSSDVQLISEARGPLTANSATVTHAAARQALDDAMHMIRSGEHSMAIPRLTSVASRYPSSDAAVDAWYFLGLTYYKIDGLYNAERYFSKYLSLRPEGKYAALSRDYVAGISKTLRQRHSDREALALQVAKYDGVSEPEELASHLELAEAYWNNRDYEKAGVIYTKVLKAWPSLKDDMIIRRRMDPGPDGGWVILTPEEINRRYNEAEPLSIFNTAKWQSGRYRPHQYDYRNVYYNVSGQAVNRSETPLRDVRVTTTIFSFGGQVYDVRTVQLGTLRPGETRAFSVRFTNFDNVENVDRYECVGTYQR